MRHTDRSRRDHVLLRSAAAIAVLAGCATARPSTSVPRLVTAADWGAVVDCVVLSARASELYAEVDSSGISITPGFTPLAQQRATARAGAVGTVRIDRMPAVDGLRITTSAEHWDAPTVGRRDQRAASATRAMAQRLEAQCLAGYPAAATD